MRAGRKQHILSDLFILEISEDICEKTASPRRGNFELRFELILLES